MESQTAALKFKIPKLLVEKIHEHEVLNYALAETVARLGDCVAELEDREKTLLDSVVQIEGVDLKTHAPSSRPRRITSWCQTM